MKQVFVINGSGGVGKDTFVDLVTIVSGLKAMQYSSVDKIKAIARDAGWNGIKDEKSRKFLSDLKVLCSEFCDLPFKSLVEIVDYFRNDTGHEMLFLHIREPNEIKRAVNEFDAKTILVTRDTVPAITSNMADGGVYDYIYDIAIRNDGDMEELRNKAKQFYSDFKQGSFKNEY